jgi:hypothetical protein
MAVIILTAWFVLAALSSLVFAAVGRAGLDEDRALGYLPRRTVEPRPRPSIAAHPDRRVASP